MQQDESNTAYFKERLLSWYLINGLGFLQGKPDKSNYKLIIAEVLLQRSKRLHALAVEMTKRNEILPKDRSSLDEIPFLGQYIANSIELLF